MRNFLPKLFAVLLFLIFTTALRAQVGMIAFTGYNKDDNTVNGAQSNDDFSFVLLQNIAAGTTIFFTDLGWTDANAFQDPDACGAGTGAVTDGIISWTTAVPLNRGTQVRIRCRFPSAGGTTTAMSATVGTATGVKITKNSVGTGINEYLNLGVAGDQIFAYTGTFAAPTLVAGIDMTAGWEALLGACDFTSANSRLPTALSTNNYAFTFTTEFDNGRLKETVKLTNPANANTDRTNISTQTNWDFSDLTAFLLPGNLFILPVNFTWIKAAERSSSVQVDFGVGAEDQIIEYQIQRSADGRVYSTIGTIPASRQSSYSWPDAQPIAGNNFYRIKAIELSGDTKFSTVVNINLSKTGKGGINVYPNAVRNSRFTLQITNRPAGSYKLNLYSVTGQLVMTRALNHAGGSATQTVNVPASIQKGVYKLSLTGASATDVTTIIIQ